MVPVGFSHVASTVIAPSSTFQLLSPDQPLSVLPSNSDVQPSCSLKSIGSGCLKPPKPPWRPPAGRVATGGCCIDADAEHTAATAATAMTSVPGFMRTSQHQFNFFNHTFRTDTLVTASISIPICPD